MAVRQLVEHTAHAFGGIVLNMAHIGFHNILAEKTDHLFQLGDALFVGGDLRLQVVDVLRQVADGVGRTRQQSGERFLAEGAAINQLEIVDIDAFLLDIDRKRRHGTRRDAANIRVMATASDPEADFAIVVIENRRAYCKIGQMRAAIIRRVDEEHIARLDVAVFADGGGDGCIHGTQMHRHMRRIGDEIACRVENCAGKVETFLDVHRIGGVLKRHAHLLGYGHEEIVENLQHDRIGFGADGRAGGQRLDARQHHMVMRGQASLPAIFDDDGLVFLDDDCRAGDGLAALHLLTQDDARIVQRALREEAGPFGGCRFQIAVERLGAFGLASTSANGFNFHCVDNESLVFRNEAETALMGGLELGAKTVGIILCREGGFNGEHRVGARIADVGAQMTLHGFSLYALGQKFNDAFLRQFFAEFFQG